MYELKLGNLIIESLCLLRCFKHVNKTSIDIQTFLSRPVYFQLELYNFLTQTEHVQLVTQDSSKYCIYKLANDNWIISGNLQPTLTVQKNWKGLLGYINNILARTVTGIWFCNSAHECKAIYNSQASLSSSQHIIHAYLMNSMYKISQESIDTLLEIPCKCPKTFVNVALNSLGMLNPFVVLDENNINSKTVSSSPHIILYCMDNSQTALVKFKDHKWMIQYISGSGMIQDTEITSSKSQVYNVIQKLAGILTEIHVFTGLDGSQPIILKL